MAEVPASARLPESIYREPGAPVPVDQRQHPRRTVVSPRGTQQSLGNKRQKLSHSPEDIDVASAPAGQIRSQGSSSDQSATRWFDRVNEHVAHNVRASHGYDDEPPFFMSNQTNYRPNSFEQTEGSKIFGIQSRVDSENEDLRGVIDDLTVENKRLKQILRVNQRSQRNSPNVESQDKLFEVRMHGLGPDKRRELEFLLKNFATSVHTSVPSMANSVTGSGGSSNGLANYGKAKTDSGYASNSNSGQQSLLQSQSKAIPSIPKSARNSSMKSYLRDIPDILMPRQQPIVMSERAKMALVVRRLEQLFTGRKAAPGEHVQPLQQQEVSQMAARADAKTSQKRKAEGSREAHILPPDSKFNFDTIDVVPEKRKKMEPKSSESDSSVPEGVGSTISRPGSPDQRPTRPLDLDIHRAQVAAENIQYLRHLGLTSPGLDTNQANDAWMFLNLLINMAQLHTINVTPEFVRRSIKKLSSKFELSKDGHRVRWIGGPEGTIFSKEEEKALETVDSNKETHSPEDLGDDLGNSGSSKRSKTDSNSNAMASNTTSDDKTSGLQPSSTSKLQSSTAATSLQPSQLGKHTPSGSAFDYKPIVYRERTGDLPAEDSYLIDSDSSPGTTSQDSSGLAHALSRSNLNQQRRADEGLITFYTNAFFCSDYSGDKMPSNMRPARDAEPGLTLGISPDNDWYGETSRLAHACYFTPQFGPARFRQTSDESIPKLNVVPLSSTAGEEETRPLEFPVSGLGGVVPDDNFAIDVDVHMSELSANARSKPLSRVPLTDTEVKPKFGYTQGDSHKIDLLPTRLPPASYIFFASSSSSGNLMDEDESLDDSDETSSADEDQPAPPAFLRHWSAEDSGDVDSVYNDEEEEEDDSSVDFLATARAVDPARIAEQERQYMINQPGGRAVAGSLAATVGASRSSTSVNDVDSDKPEAGSDSGDDYEVSDIEMD